MSNNDNKKTTNICGQPVECYSRVTGYFRPVANWNKGKQEEFKDRLKFNVDIARNHLNTHKNG